MSRRLFGWSLPPGCTMNDIEDHFGGDDESSCTFCGNQLPENTEDKSWEFQGFCNAICAVKYMWLDINRHRSPNLHGTVYEDFGRALKEILNDKSQQ